MEPRFRFVRSGDGHKVTYATLGSGPPLVYIPPWGISNPELDFRQPLARAFFERLAKERTLVFLVRRCLAAVNDPGLDLSLDAQVSDLEAVAGALGQGIDVWAMDDGCAIAVTYAASRADSVRHLVLWGAYARTRGSDDPVVRALIEMARNNWALARRSFADLNFPSGPQELRAWFADYHRQSLSAEVTARFLAFSADADVRDRLKALETPSLVLHRRGDRVVALRAGRTAAALLANASLIVLDGDIHVPYFGDLSYVSAVEAFLADAPHGDIPAEKHSAAFCTVLFTDIVGHTEMMRRLGDSEGREVLRAHERITRDALGEYGGREVKTMGDGFMASFASATTAVECAVALQRSLASWNEGASGWGKPAVPLRVRVALNAGEPIEEDGDLFGETVILAARIAAEAEPEQILVPEPVRHLLAGKGFVFADKGEFTPKGFDEPVRLYEVRWRK